MTVRDAFALYMQSALDHLRWQDLVEAEFFLVDFAEQFGDLDVAKVSMRHVNVYCRQAKEGADGVHYWLPVTRRQAAGAITRALDWLSVMATRLPESP